MTIARNSRLDGIKLLLIVLVVIGHCIEPSRYNNAISGSIYSVIYSFHMPLFVFISGYFAKVNSVSEWRNKGVKFIESFMVIMIPQVFYCRSLSLFINPEHSGWYLMSLLWWYGILLFFRRCKISGWGGVIISFIISLTVFLLPLGSMGRYFSFNRTLQMLPFFITGNCIRKQVIPVPFNLTSWKKTVFLILSSIIIVFLILLSSSTLHILEYYYIDAWSVCDFSGQPIGIIIFGRLLLITSAIVLSICIIDNFILPPSIACYGKYTLVIYVIQGVLARLLPLVSPNLFWVELIIAVSIIVISLLLIKTVDCRYITNPISTLTEKIIRKNNENS